MNIEESQDMNGRINFEIDEFSDSSLDALHFDDEPLMLSGPANTLVASADAETAELVVSVLRWMGNRVRCASTGSDAWRIVGSTAIHLVISDVEMSEGDGVWLLAKIRANNVSAPVILISNRDRLKRAEALSLGAADILEKPLTAEVLSHSIAKCLQAKNQEKA